MGVSGPSKWWKGGGLHCIRGVMVLVCDGWMANARSNPRGSLSLQACLLVGYTAAVGIAPITVQSIAAVSRLHPASVMPTRPVCLPITRQLKVRGPVRAPDRG
jgi:hypothetical protein